VVPHPGEDQGFGSELVAGCVVPLIKATTFPRSTSESSSIFENGRLKQGGYKIQNLYSETYLDIHKYSQEMRCRPVRDLEGGKGLVRLCYQSFPIYISNGSKWEIKHFGVGYTVRRVSMSIKFGPLFVMVSPIDQRRFRLNLENLTNSVLRWTAWTAGLRSTSTLIL
jgi:hypothetical protein